jgi:hypothetical protein
MLKNISERFYQWNKGWLIFILFLLDAFFSGFLLPLVQAMLQTDKGGIQPLDLMLFATPQRIFGMINEYGEYGLSRRGTDSGYYLPHCVLVFLWLVNLMVFSAWIHILQPHAEIQHHAVGRMVL